MSITITKELGNLHVISVDGILTYDDLKEGENKAVGIKNSDQKAQILVLAEQFSGWGKGGDWGDLTFMHEHDPYIEKIAVVADEKWRDEILMFLGAGRRKASVEFFYPDEVEDARDWLQDQNV